MSLKSSVRNFTNWMAPSCSAASRVTLEVSPGSEPGVSRPPKDRMETSHLLKRPLLLSQQMPQPHRLQNQRGILQKVALPKLSTPNGMVFIGSPLPSSPRVHGLPAFSPGHCSQKTHLNAL